ncbi:MAG: NAD-dependent epimerase/dehydratase family protein [Candidatus Bathyarchaeia archaeon]
MKRGRVLVSGGAGFIGSFTVDQLIERGYDVVVLDSLEPQVHQGRVPEYFNEKARLIKGDVTDGRVLARLIREVDSVIHFAARVGVGQSMYEIEPYIKTNAGGTATILDAIVNQENSVSKLVLASSMSVYGEGKYNCESCGGAMYPGLRSEEQLKRRAWEPLCPNCGSPLKPVPTDEESPQMPMSIYAMTKLYQEEMCLLVAETYGLPTVVLRYFNVYGPRQALANPYTGVCAIFSNRILNDHPPYIFEDGKQTRDFVSVRDVARVNVDVLERNSADYEIVNIGSGTPVSIEGVAKLLIRMYGKRKMRPFISQRYRRGDIRHCFADISKAKNLLDFTPKVGMEEGFSELVRWGRTHDWGASDLFEKAMVELEGRGLAST